MSDPTTRGKRIQRQRVKGWKMPPGAKYVGRPTKWGNPWFISDFDNAQDCVDEYREWLLKPGMLYRYDARRQWILDHLEELRSHDLVCWCALYDNNGLRIPCHADVLLELLEAK